MRSSSAHARCSGADKASASKRAAVDAPTAPEAKRRKVEVVVSTISLICLGLNADAFHIGLHARRKVGGHRKHYQYWLNTMQPILYIPSIDGWMMCQVCRSLSSQFPAFWSECGAPLVFLH